MDKTLSVSGGCPRTSVPPVDYLELQDPKVRAIIAKGCQEYLAGKSRPAEELLHALQELPHQKKGKATRRERP